MSIPALAESSTSRVNICTKEETWRFDKWQRHYAINPAHLAAVKEVSSKLSVQLQRAANCLHEYLRHVNAGEALGPQ